MEQIELIEEFIKQIDDILIKNNEFEAEKLQLKIIATFRNYIVNLESDLTYDMPDYYSDAYLSRADYILNLDLLKCKLMSYLAELKSENSKPILDKKNETTVNINNSNTNTNTNNNMDMKVVFDEARKVIDENESLEEESIEKMKDKITELETIFNSTDSKKDKWSKCSEILLWVSYQGVAIATIIVPLIAKCLQNK